MFRTASVPTLDGKVSFDPQLRNYDQLTYFSNEKVHSINGFSLGILTIEPRLSPVSNSGWLTQNQLSGILVDFLSHFGHSLSCWYIGSCLYIAVSNFVLFGFWISFSLSSLLLVPTSLSPCPVPVCAWE